MYKKCYWFIWLLAILLISTSVVIAEEEQNNNERIISPSVAHSIHYAIPDENNFIISDKPINTKSLGTSSSRGVGPGTIIGTTWYDYQHNGSMGRMVDWTYDITSGLDIHFSWMYLPAPVFANRQMGYNSYLSSVGSLLGTILLGDFAGYVNIGTTNDGRAIVGGHNNDGIDYVSKFFFQNSPGSSIIDTSIAVPAALPNYQQAIWPKFRYIEGPTDTVLHVITKIPEAGANGDGSAIYYFRRVGGKDFGSWDSPPRVIDTNFNIAYDIDANLSGKVALVWPAKLPSCFYGDPPECDTCSCNESTNSSLSDRVNQWDNDIYYQVSLDNGVNWQPRVNVTNYINDDGIDGFRAYNNLSALLSTSGDLHIVWDASFWPADAYSGGTTGVYKGKFFHWSENNPFKTVAHDFNWDQTVCNGGSWQLNATKPSISECNNRFYLLFVQFNDIPGGVTDDCATSSSPGYPTGAANGDLWITLSEDGGATWASAVNITNTYAPDCDPADGWPSGPCASEVWPSMSRFGSNYTGNFSNVEIIEPDGYTDGYYLDVQYIDDPSPGGIIQIEGTWQETNVKWFRLACTDEFPLTGACCDQAGGCTITEQATCEGAGNVYMGDGTSCTPNPCAQPTGACCDEITGACIVTEQSTCETAGFTYQGDGTTCTPNPCTCCNHDGIRGDVFGDPGVLVDDLTFLVDYLFKQGPTPDCLHEADANGDGDVFVDDLTLMVDYLFKQGPPPEPCP